MRKVQVITILALAVGVLLVSASATLAQEKGEPAKPAPTTSSHDGAIYRLDFTVRELDGETTVNSRSYLMFVGEEGRNSGRIRASSQVPVRRKDTWSYMDVGLNLDCTLTSAERGLTLRVTFDISNFATEEPTSASTIPPIIRRISSTVTARVKPGISTVISTVDDTGTNRRYTMEVKATKVE